MKFTIVVSGHGVAVNCRLDKMISNVLADVLKQTGDVAFVDWELRLLDGHLVDQSDYVGEVVENGDTLFLNPHCGVGAATLTPAIIEANMDRARAELPELDAKLDDTFCLPERGMVLR